jgi:ParB family transcriptional regulator, chromosome partitioning protein
MAKPPAFSLQSSFSGAKASQETHSLKAQIAELQAELEQVRSGQTESSELVAEKVEALTSTLSSTGGVTQVDISQIEPDVNQPRKTFPQQLILERAESLRQNGQISPVILIALPTGNYKLFDGELRWRAATFLKWDTLKAVFIPEHEVPSAEELFEGQIVAGIHSQRLHELDLADALIKYTVSRFPHFEGQELQIPKILNTAIRRLDRDHKLSELADVRVLGPHQQQDWLESAGFQLHPATVNSHVFSLLKLADDLKVAIREEGIEPRKAKEIGRLTFDRLQITEDEACKLRVDLMQQAIQEKMSLAAVRASVNALIQQYAPNTKSLKDTTPLSKLTQALKTIDLTDATPDALKELQVQLKETLKEVKGMLEF